MPFGSSVTDKRFKMWPLGVWYLYLKPNGVSFFFISSSSWGLSQSKVEIIAWDRGRAIATRRISARSIKTRRNVSRSETSSIAERAKMSWERMWRLSTWKKEVSEREERLREKRKVNRSTNFKILIEEILWDAFQIGGLLDEYVHSSQVLSQRSSWIACLNKKVYQGWNDSASNVVNPGGASVLKMLSN